MLMLNSDEDEQSIHLQLEQIKNSFYTKLSRGDFTIDVIIFHARIHNLILVLTLHCPAYELSYVLFNDFLG